MSETSGAEDQRVLYIRRVLEFSKFVDFIGECYKVSVGTYLNREGKPRSETTCKVGPVFFKAVYSKQQRMLETTALISLEGKDQRALIPTGIKYLLDDYLKFPESLNDMLDLEQELRHKVENARKIVKTQVSEGMSAEKRRIALETDRLQEEIYKTNVVRGELETEIQRYRSKRDKLIFKLLGSGCLGGWALTVLLVHMDMAHAKLYVLLFN